MEVEGKSSPEPPDSEASRTMSEALQTEDEFLEYLVSVADKAQPAPALLRSTSSSGGGVKVGLDHLDNLCKLMEQLGGLREQNSRLQRRVQYLEDLKDLHEMHKQLQEQGGTDATECATKKRNAKCKSASNSRIRQSLLRCQQRERSRSVGIDTEFQCEREREDDGKGPPRPAYHPQRRSVGGVEGASKAKVSKWTKVKEAFRWEKVDGLLRVPPPSGDGDSAAAHSPTDDFLLPSPGGVSSSSSSSEDFDIDLNLADILAELGPQRSASATDSTGKRQVARRLSLSPEEEDVSRRSKSLDGDATIINRHFSGKDGKGKAHKTPWGKVKDIIQTRKDSLKKRHHEEDAEPPPLDDPPPDKTGKSWSGKPHIEVSGENPGSDKRQHSKASLSNEDCKASRRLTPVLTLTLPSNEELRSLQGAASSKPPPSPQAEDRHHKTSTASAPGGTADEAPSSRPDCYRRQASIPRPTSSSAGTSSPAYRRASKWTKVKKAFLTSAPGRHEGDSLSISVPSSPSRNSSFFYEVGGDESGSGASRVKAEIRRDYEELQQKLSLEFHRKLREWERIKSVSASATPAPGGGGDQDKGFRHKMVEWERMKAQGWGGPSLLDDNLSPDFRKKLHEWERLKLLPRARDKELQWLEKELHKIEREKQRLEREREKYLEREARLDKMRRAMGSGPRKQEVLIQTSTGFFRFQGISEKFTKRLYEWEKARGIRPEASTFALLDPGYKPPPSAGSRGTQDGAGGVGLSRSKSASSVTKLPGGGASASSMTHQPSSLSLNDVEVLGPADAANLEESRAASEPRLHASSAAADEPAALIVDVEDVIVETAAPLLATPAVESQTPVYCYAPEGVTQLIDSSGSDSERDGDQESYKLLDENMSLLSRMRYQEGICRKIENEIEDLENKIEDAAKSHEKEMERLRREETDLTDLSTEPEGRGGRSEQTMARLKTCIRELERRQERLRREGATLQDTTSVPQGAIQPSQSSEDLAQIAAKVLELKTGRAFLCASPEMPMPKSRESSMVSGGAGDDDDEPTATFVFKIREKLPEVVQVDSEGNTSPVTCVTIVPGFWQRKRREEFSYFSSATSSVFDDDDETELIDERLERYDDSDEEGNISDDDDKDLNVSQSTVRHAKKTDSEGDDSLDHSDEENDKTDYSTGTTINKSLSRDSSCKYGDAEGTEGHLCAKKENNQYYETEVLPAMKAITPSGRVKKLLKTRRVSDTHVGYTCKEDKRGSFELPSQGEINDREENSEEEAKEKPLSDNSKRSPKYKLTENRRNLRTGTEVNRSIENDNSESVIVPTTYQFPNLTMHGRKHDLVGDASGTSSGTDLPSKQLSVLEYASDTPVPPNVFVKTTRKIFSPVNRDSKGKASSVISYVVGESSPKCESESPVGQSPEKFGGFKSAYSHVSKSRWQQRERGDSVPNDNETDDLPAGMFANTATAPPAWMMRRSRSQSSSPAMSRRQDVESKEGSYNDETSKATGAIRKNISDVLNESTDTSSTSQDESRGSAGRALCRQPIVKGRVDGPATPSPGRRELMKLSAKETAPSIRMMIAKYNLKLTEQEGAGGRSPEIGGSGSGSPVAWRSPVAERRVRAQMEKYQDEVCRALQHGGRIMSSGEVQKSASAGVIRAPVASTSCKDPGKEDQDESNTDTIPKEAPSIKQRKGILKSSSAGSIKPVSSLPLQLKEPTLSRMPEYGGKIAIVPPPEPFKDNFPNTSRPDAKPPSPRLPLSPAASNPSSPEMGMDHGLRALKLKRAKEEFLTRGPGGQSWTSEDTVSPEPFEDTAGHSLGQDDNKEQLLVKSASAGMINVDPSAYCLFSAGRTQPAAGGATPKSQLSSKFGIASIASRFCKVKMRRNKDPPRMKAVSTLCRQSLLVDIHRSDAATPEAPSSKSCPSSPVLQRPAPHPPK